MHIYCLGVNHNTAPVNIREKLAFSEEAVRTGLAQLGCGAGIGDLNELLILSTCNRIELYAVSSQPAFSDLETFLISARGLRLTEIRPYLYHFSGPKAVRHLLNVSAGLDSLVLGEPQILGQITRALELARGVGTTGPLLNRLFQRAIHAGKRARTETAISRNPASVSSLAAATAEKYVPSLALANVAILGAGEMAELAVEALRKRGVKTIRVVNRTLERARLLAERWQAEASTFESLENVLAEVDILISSTGAPHIILTAEMVSAVMKTRPQRPLVLLDIAVPRDIDPSAGEISGVQLFDIDNLSVSLENALSSRAAEVPLVEEILEQEQAAFMDFMRSLDMLPLIIDMRRQAETIRAAELEKTLKRLPELSASERQRIEAMTQALVKKMLEAPTNRLRAEANSPQAPEYATVARTLFGIQPSIE